MNRWKPQIWIRNGFRLAILGAVGAGDPFRRSLGKNIEAVDRKGRRFWQDLLVSI